MNGQPDLIVVGGGSAGVACAARLADAGKRVLLIEAGKSDRHVKSRIPALVGGVVQNPDFDWCYRAEPDPSIGGRPDVWPAGKRLGGGSAINGMMFIRGHRWDYDHWAKLGATGWDYESVLPYFRRIENNERGEDPWRGVGGPIDVSEVRSRYPVTEAWIEAVRQAGFSRSADLNGESAEGVDHVQLSQRAGLRCSTATGYLGKKRPNLEVMLEAEVFKIVVEGGRATGVTVRRGSDRQTIRSLEGVVLSAGALNTPRLLMLSGIGPAGHLSQFGIEVIRDLPAVGANLQEHAGLHLINEVSARTLNDEARGIPGAVQLFKLLLSRSGALTTGIGHAQAFLKSQKGLPAPNLQFAFSAFAFDVTPNGNLALRPTASVTTLVALMRPSSRGRVRLRSSNPADAPCIEHRLLGSDDDVMQLVEGLQIARRIMVQDALDSLVTSEVRPGSELQSSEALQSYVRAAAMPMFHPVGTAKIGAGDDPNAVVDPDLRVREIEGLWVADASVMPTIPAGNTTATAIMIGDKAADHILRVLAHGGVSAPKIGAMA
jgi:choline dehydrogenase